MGVILIITVSLVIAVLAVIAIVKFVNRSITSDMNNGRRNFKVRFNPNNNKYYLTNATQYGDLDVVRFGLFRVYYKSKIDADFVMQKLNDPS